MTRGSVAQPQQLPCLPGGPAALRACLFRTAVDECSRQVMIMRRCACVCVCVQVEQIRVRCRAKEGRMVDGWVRSSDKQGSLLDLKPFSEGVMVKEATAAAADGVEEGTPPAAAEPQAEPEPEPEPQPEPEPEGEPAAES